MQRLLLSLLTITLFLFPKENKAQAPNLGTAADFVLFTTTGAVTNMGIPFETLLTGNVGTNSAPTILGFGNINGQMHYVGDPASMQCTADLNAAYLQLDAAVPTFFLAVGLGGGQILTPGVHYVSASSVLGGDLILDGQNDPTSVFIIQIDGTFSTDPNSKVKLINGALACNVFWKVEGAVSMGTGTTMRGTIVANNGAITMAVGDTLEGRALSTAGAILVDGLFGYTPIGCGSPTLLGPAKPILGSAACFGVFTSIGAHQSFGVTEVDGDVGSNSTTTNGYVPLLVTGTIHGVPDGATGTAATDVGIAYAYLNGLVEDIILLEPTLFGHNLTLTPHIYLLPAAVTFTDTVFLDAQGEADAVFVIQVEGAFGTSTFSKVVLLNGADAANVFWNINGAVSINDFSIFNGTIIADGAITLATGVQLNGRALTINGAISVTDAFVIIPPSSSGIIVQPIDQTACLGDAVSFTVGGSASTYQWRKGIVNLMDGGNISGTNTATLTIDPVTLLDAANDYNVIISGDCGASETSVNVSLTIETSPIIITDPSNQTVCVGDSTAFVVEASGGNLTYQWRLGLVNLIDGGNISGSNNDTLVINPAGILDAANNYNVVITGSCTPSVTSINVELMVNPIPTITSEPLDVTVCVGDSAAFIVVATGNNLTYQWRDGIVNLVNGVNIFGVTNDTLIINPVGLIDASLNYNVIVSGGCLTNDTSIMAALNVNTNAIITNEPIDALACEGTTATFTVTATSALSYQWRKGTVNLINGGNISGATTATLTINPTSLTDAALNYNVIVIGACTVNDTSINVELAITAAPNATASSNSPVCTGDSLNLFTPTVTGATYDWSNTNGYTSMAQNPTIMNADILNSDTYTVVVTANGCTSTSSVVVLVDDCTDFFIPQGFSPNGDGINDFFFVRGIDRFPENTMLIYNRWGDKVFEATPYMNTWDGQSQFGITVGGEVLPVGTYFYVLDLGDGSEIHKGTVYLNQ